MEGVPKSQEREIEGSERKQNILLNIIQVDQQTGRIQNRRPSHLIDPDISVNQAHISFLNMDHPEVLLRQIKENVKFLWPKDRLADPLFNGEYRLLTATIYDRRPSSPYFDQRFEKMLVVTVDLEGNPASILVQTTWQHDNALLALHVMLSELVADLFIGGGLIDSPTGYDGATWYSTGVRDPNHEWYSGPHRCGRRQGAQNFPASSPGHQRHISAPAVSQTLRAQEHDGHDQQDQGSTSHGPNTSDPQDNGHPTSYIPSMATRQPDSPAMRYPSIKSVLHHQTENQAHEKAPENGDSFELSSVETWTPADPNQDGAFQRYIPRSATFHGPNIESPRDSEFSGASYETWTPPGIYMDGNPIGEIRRTSGNRTGVQYNVETPSETELDSRVQGRAWARQPFFYVAGGPHDPKVLRAAAAARRQMRQNAMTAPSNQERSDASEGNSDPAALRRISVTTARTSKTANLSSRQSVSNNASLDPLPVNAAQTGMASSSQAPEMPPLQHVTPLELPAEQNPQVNARRQNTFVLGPVPVTRSRNPSIDRSSKMPSSTHGSTAPDTTTASTQHDFTFPGLNRVAEGQDTRKTSRRPSTSLAQHHPYNSDETVLYRQQPPARISSTDTIVPTRRNVTPHPVLPTQDEAAGHTDSPAEQSLQVVRQRFVEDENQGAVHKVRRKVKQLGRRVSRGFSGGSGPDA